MPALKLSTWAELFSTPAELRARQILPFHFFLLLEGLDIQYVYEHLLLTNTPIVRISECSIYNYEDEVGGSSGVTAQSALLHSQDTAKSRGLAIYMQRP